MTSRVVRAAVFDAAFWTDLLVVTVPLLVLASICAALYRIGITTTRGGDT